MNDIKQPLTEYELHQAWKSDFTARMVSKSMNRVVIPVMGETFCWTCRKDFMAKPFQWYCSDSCQSIGENREDNWDGDR